MLEPLVEVQQGMLQGHKINENFYIFKGIPYAKPPIGELRFTVPVPPEPWQGIRDATKNANICSQYDIETNSIVGSEDCLYLNVNTPRPNNFSEGLLPVMVFIHGGGFIFGNGTDERTHGVDYLVEKNVVVVTFNYRQGILGFLSLDRKDAPGNMGLRDQVEALKWIKKNIRQFGGDPNNVTIFGISAGGSSVEYLMLSPMAKGLFHKAISQSGSSLLPWAQNYNSRDLTMKIISMKQQSFDNDEDILQFLKEMPVQDLVISSMQARALSTFQGGLYFGFVPIIEKPKDWEPFLDTSPYDLLLRGEFAKIPFMSGFCSQEGLIMTSAMGNMRLNTLLKENDPENYLNQFFGINDNEIQEVASRLKEAYTPNPDEEPNVFGINFFTDIDFLGGIYTAASYIVKHNPSVYLYEFSYDGNLNYIKIKLGIELKGACHGDDGGYIVKSDMLMAQPVSETDDLVRKRLVLMWTNFAKYGVPTLETDEIITTQWTPMGTNVSYLFIDENLSMKQDPYPKRTHLYKELYDKYYSKLHKTQ